MNPKKTVENSFPLWQDDPASIDLLSFDAVAATVTEALLDDNLDPIALGLSGGWGSGKTTVLRIIAKILSEKNTPDSKVIIVSTDPWRYDPTTGAKESLISEILAGLAKEIDSKKDPKSTAKKLVQRLVKRVDWSKAIRLTAKTAIALQVPSFDDVLDIVKDPEGEDAVRGLSAFREEFNELMDSGELAHVKRVVVLVDDLDRCLPETVIESLEAIRLFLAVPKMSFVLAADEERVADAIRTRYPNNPTSSEKEQEEEPASLYLHKIVQTTVPIPSLSRFDTQSYILLLLLMNKLTNKGLFEQLVEQCADLRIQSKSIDDLPGIDGENITEELVFASRLTPLLYEKLHGNPRRIKRFMNDLYVRQSVAANRGITLEAPVVAKLMVLELLLKADFQNVLNWLANGELRPQIEALEAQAGRKPSSDVKPQSEKSDKTPDFPEPLIRWAKLPPSLKDIDLTPYLYLAASFSSKTLLDQDLPERLRDIAANMLSSVKAEQHSISGDDITSLTTADATALIEHLGRVGRDRPADQRKAVSGMLRIVRVHMSVLEHVKQALTAIPADEISIPSILLFNFPQDIALRSVLDHWNGTTTKATTKTTIASALKKGANSGN